MNCLAVLIISHTSYEAVCVRVCIVYVYVYIACMCIHKLLFIPSTTVVVMLVYVA